MGIKRVLGWAGVGVLAAIISYAVAYLARQQTILEARALHDQTIGDVNDLMKGLQKYAQTTFRGIE